MLEVEQRIENEQTEKEQLESKKEQKQETNEKIEVKPQTDTRFDLARALGKTESGLKNEFYDYQIKGFMAKTGCFNDEVQENFSETDGFTSLIRSGVGEYAVTPYFFSGLKGAQKKVKDSPLKFTAILDFPKGESSYYARLADVKQATKRGFKSIMITVPDIALFLKNPSKTKMQLNRLSKISKNRLGLIVNSNGDNEKLKKALAHLMSVKAERLVLRINGEERDCVSTFTKTALTYSGKKKLFVCIDSEKTDIVAELLSLKVDGVYLKNPLVVSKELQKKFSVNV